MSKHPAMTVSGEQVTNQGRIQEVGEAPGAPLNLEEI